MSPGVLSGAITAALLALFCGLCAWAYSRRRRGEFEAAARMPLEDDLGRHGS
jgi:cytochrome c oxidase cbb3-type subunit 4